MATKVQPRPKSTAFTGAYERKVWDEKYKSTHNPDGTPKAGVAPKKEAAAPKTTSKTSAEPAAKKMLGGREVKNGKVFVSKEELDAFKKKYGTGKTLTDLLNKERNLTRREDKSKLKPLKSVAEDRKALDEAAAKKKAREEEVKKMVKAAGLAKGGMPNKRSK